MATTDTGTTAVGNPDANKGTIGETASGLSLTTGWYVFFGLAFGVLTSETQLAPISLGILTVALLFQIDQLIEGK